MSYFLARLREPSTYAGIAAMLTAFGVTMEPGLVQNVSVAGIALAGVASAVMAEKK